MLDASPCRPDHEFPHIPDNVTEEAVLLSLLGLVLNNGCDRGISRLHVGEGWRPGFGDGDPRGEARRVRGGLLKGESPSSSRPDISLRCLGRRPLVVAGMELVRELGWEEDAWVVVGWFMPTTVEARAA